MKSFNTTLAILFLALFFSCTVDTSSDEDLLENEDNIELSTTKTALNKSAATDYRANLRPFPNGLYERIKVYNPDLAPDFIYGDKELIINLPDGSTVPVYQTKEFLRFNYLHNLNNITNTNASGKWKTRTKFEKTLEFMASPLFDIKNMNLSNAAQDVLDEIRFTSKTFNVRYQNGNRESTAANGLIRLPKYAARTIHKSGGVVGYKFTRQMTNSFNFLSEEDRRKVYYQMNRYGRSKKYTPVSLRQSFPN